ncbi:MULTISPECIES: response regulator transcription factor [unclassified Caballeronia]|uniref:response regulator transcription factor n=1 Tax=unclassified Caballeronia TaxID=2646786 RepID=UPI00285E3B61|nr:MULTISPECIES: response regulator transcription factor [unclassified Caballeronia]MDR5813480.1 response regulator transcription factor [Caballeronia sp. LZ033]MDR5820237.1 response regulator transcription factor [Caballeronia sp. LZ043]MDR5878054.1 response regulator transcription factor [Caballeronia sp. LZ032]
MRVLLVEDGHSGAEPVHHALKDYGYVVDLVHDDKTALLSLSTHVYDAVLLDAERSGPGGLAVLRKVRRAGGHVPVIALTARGAVAGRIRALNEGADDCVSKPFDMLELDARLHALMRRLGAHSAALLTNGVLTLNPATREARSDAAATRLSGREFALLQALLMQPGAVLSRADLEDHIYGWTDEVESNAVEFLIHTVRKKLGAEVIRNVRGVGWMVSRPA